MPYSTYSRLRDLLANIGRRQPIDIFDLSDVVHNKQVESFAIWRRDSSGASIKQYCSPGAVRWLIRFLRDLGLARIENDRIVTLTPEGQNALSGGNFDAQLTTQINEYLRTNGTSFSALTQIIYSIQSPDVPDRHTIYERLASAGAKLDPDRFRRIINLLVRTGQLTSRMRRFFGEVGR